MRPLKLINRAAERPDLKSRLAGLKTRLGRVARKPAETDPQRRIMLGAALAAGLPLPALARTGHPDAELLALGRRLDEATRDYLAIRPLQKALEARRHEVIDQTFAAHGTLDSAPARTCLVETSAQFKAELSRCNAVQEEVDSVCSEILLEHRATTLEGAAVVARAVAANYFDQWAMPAGDREWFDLTAMSLAEAVLRIAGVENVAANG